MKTNKLKVCDLTGAALDWAVAKCWYTDRAFEPTEGRTTIRVLRSPENTGEYHSDWFMFRPSTEWTQGGPIIERERITVSSLFTQKNPPIPEYDKNEWGAYIPCGVESVGNSSGPTPLIAAMRCYVASKLGDDVDVPPELI